MYLYFTWWPDRSDTPVMATVTPPMSNTTINSTAADWQTQILLSGYLATMIFGSCLGIFGTVSLCRRAKQTQLLHIYFYHIIVVEMFQNLIILNMRALLLLKEITNQDYYTVNVLDYSLSGIAVLTLTINAADIHYRVKHPTKPGLLTKRVHFVYLFIAVWLWSGVVISLPAITMVTLEYLGPDYQYMWDTSQHNTWAFILIAVLIITQILPLIALSTLSILVCHKKKTNNRVWPAKDTKSNRSVTQPSQAAWHQERPHQSTTGVICHAVLLGCSQIAFLTMLLCDTNQSVTALGYNWCILLVRICGVLGTYCQMFIDKSLKKELAIGLKCSDHWHVCLNHSMTINTT